YPQTAATMVAGAGVFWIAAVAEAAARGPRAALSAVVSLPAAVALGLLLAGAQVLPFGEAAALSERAEPYETTRVLQETLQPGHLLQLASPRIFGLPGYQRYWGGTLWQFWLGSFYAGLITLLCACLAPAAAAGLRESPGGPAGPRWGIAAASLLLVFGLLLSHGDTTPFAGWVVSAVAGFGYFRWFATTSVLFVFALCFLAPFGMDHLLSRARSGGRAALRAGAFVAVPAAAAMALAVTAAAAPGAFVGLVRLAVAPVMHADQQAAFAASAPLARADAFGAAGVLAAGALVLAACASGRLSRRRAGWCLTLILLADLCLAARGLNAAGDPAVYTEPPTSLDRVRRSTAGPARLYVPDETLKHDLAMYGSRDEQMFRWASAAFLYNLNIPWGLFSASDGDPIRPRRMGAWHAAVESEQDLERRRRLLAAANVSVVLYGEPGSDLRGSQVPDALPRALVAAGARREPPEAMLEIIASGAWDPRREVLVEEDFRGVPLPPGPPVRHTVHALDYTANGVTLDVEAASEGYLVLLDMAYPGWRADVDGRPARLFKANFMFRGLELPAGRHIVRFRYRPGALAAGAVASAIGLMIACAAVWADRRPGLSRRSAPTRRNGPSPGTGSAPRRTEPTP
ncbi:MAG TPA: YfhO family protein, partial [Candidatus Polarisedimenticolia bacterium]|nr:YfhO family protein [Candidatus Polarisedimenticolia bacterium]